LSATAVIHAAPNAISIVTSATVATVQDALLSIEEGGDCNIKGSSRRDTFLAAQAAFDHPHRRRSALSAALRQNARNRRHWKFPFASGGNNEIDPNLLRCSFSGLFSALPRAGQAYMSGTRRRGAPRRKGHPCRFERSASTTNTT
jgi:hypothetical protein